MNIIIDGRPFVTSSAGIAGFLRDSMTAWAELCPNDKLIVALPHDLDKTIQSGMFPQNVSFVKHTNALLSRLPNLVWLNTYFPYLVRKYNADIFYSALPCVPYFLPNKVKKIIVVHDVVNLEHADTMQWTNKLSNMLFFNRSVKKADQIWTNSIYTRNKVEHYFPVRKCNDIFTGCAINTKVYKQLNMSADEVNNLKARYNIQGNFILFVGSLEPRKNLSFLLSLIPRIYNETGTKLVVVGGKRWKNSSIRDIVEAKDFPRESTIFCNFVPNDDLVGLYNAADCFVSTSLNEGFGMPQLEALYCGCPVVTSHNSAMIEVANGKTGAYTVQGFNPDKWIEAIKQVLSNPIKPIESELTEYNWQKILKRFLNKISH